MAEVNFPISKEDWAILLGCPALPFKLRGALENPASTVELAHGFEASWPEAEVAMLYEFAKFHALRTLAEALRLGLNGLKRQRRS